MLEEQHKGGGLKETIRLKEVELRRSEQEVDSLTFRNKQLEHRVATLQDELEKQQGKQKRIQKANGNTLTNHQNALNNNASLVAEEFQKKIIENAQLISLLADKNQDLELCQRRLQELEDQVNSQMFKQSFVEDGLRQEIHDLCVKNAELEMKLLETGASGGRANSDEDSVATDNSSILADTAPSSAAAAEDRAFGLEKELNMLRARFDLLQLQTGGLDNRKGGSVSGGTEGGDGRNGGDDVEQVLFDHFSKKIDDILLEKQLAESKLVSYLAECDSLRDHLEILTNELRDQERQLNVSQRAVKTVDDHLQTTRLNYEEQISVLTEQVILLSDQLAAASH